MPVQQILVNPVTLQQTINKDRKNGKPKSSDGIITVPNLENSDEKPKPIAKKSLSTTSVVSSMEICRICHCEAEPDQPLISPCLCAGSLQYVHQSCLQRWIKSSDTKKCELCKYEFIMESKMKPITKWKALDMTRSERRKILCSVSFHVIAITCVVWSLWVLIGRTAEEVKQGQLNWPFWTKLVVVAIGFTGGLVFMYVQCKVYVQLWKRLKAFNRIILVKDVPPAPEAAEYIWQGSHFYGKPIQYILNAACTVDWSLLHFIEARSGFIFKHCLQQRVPLHNVIIPIFY